MTLENPPSGAPTPAATAAPATDIEAALLGLLAALRSHGITLPKAGAGLVTKRDVARMAGIGLSTLDRIRDRGEGPPEIQLSPRRVGFRLAIVEAWLAARQSGQQPNTDRNEEEGNM